jgi:hypothetical protein
MNGAPELALVSLQHLDRAKVPLVRIQSTQAFGKRFSRLRQESQQIWMVANRLKQLAACLM